MLVDGRGIERGERQKEVGQVRGVAETESLNAPSLISTSIAGRNVLQSLGPFIKVMKSRVAPYESAPPVSPICDALHRDTQARYSALDCSDGL